MIPKEIERSAGWEDLRTGRAESTGRKLALYLSVAATGLLLGWALANLPLLLVGGALVGLVLVLMIVVNPYLGVLFYLLIFSLRPGEVYPILATLRLERLVGALTLVALFLDQIRRHGTVTIDRSKQTNLLLLFALAVLFSVPFAFWRTAALSGLVEVGKILIFYFMIVYLVNTRTRVKVFTALFLLTIVWLAGNSLYSYFSGGALLRQGIVRATGTTSAAGNYNELGTTIASAFPLFLLITMRRISLPARLGAAAACILLVVVLVITGSRASFLGFLAGLGWLWWRSRQRVALGAIGVVLLVAAVVLMPAQYKDRYSTITTAATGGSVDGSSKGRIHAWGMGLRMVAERPLFGVGIDCFGSANGAMSGSWLNSHSLYFQVLGELGLFGSVVFFALLTEMLGLNRRTRAMISARGKDGQFEQTVLLGVYAGLVALLVSGVFGHSLLRRTWYVFAALDLAIFRLYLQLPRDEPATDGTLRTDATRMDEQPSPFPG